MTRRNTLQQLPSHNTSIPSLHVNSITACSIAITAAKKRDTKTRIMVNREAEAASESATIRRLRSQQTAFKEESEKVCLACFVNLSKVFLLKINFHNLLLIWRLKGPKERANQWRQQSPPRKEFPTDWEQHYWSIAQPRASGGHRPFRSRTKLKKASSCYTVTADTRIVYRPHHVSLNSPHITIISCLPLNEQSWLLFWWPLRDSLKTNTQTSLGRCFVQTSWGMVN